MASPSRFDVTRSYWAKFERAKKHLSALQSGTLSLDKLQLYSIFEDVEANPARIVFRLRYDNPIPDDISLSIGDCLHNFRSALDHVVDALSLPRMKKPMPSRCSTGDYVSSIVPANRWEGEAPPIVVTQ